MMIEREGHPFEVNWSRCYVGGRRRNIIDKDLIQVGLNLESGGNRRDSNARIYISTPPFPRSDFTSFL